MSAYSTSPTSVLRPTKLGLWNPLEGGAPWCSHQSLWGRVKVGYRDPQATGKTFTIPTIHHTHEYRDGKATAAARIRPSSHNLQPKQTQQAKLGGEGPGRVGGGLAGSGAYLPLQEEQVATVLSGPQASCVRSRWLLFPARAHWAAPALWLRPQMAYPVNCEVSPAWPFLEAQLASER